jgi:hypothetical protein
MKSCPGWSDCSPDCPEHPVWNASPFITWTVMKASHAKGLNSEVAKGDTLAIPWA